MKGTAKVLMKPVAIPFEISNACNAAHGTWRRDALRGRIVHELKSHPCDKGIYRGCVFGTWVGEGIRK